MCSLGLLVGIFSAAAPQEAPAARPVIVRFKDGPVVAAYGVRPFLNSGFEVQERNENRFWNPPQDKVTPNAAAQPEPMEPNAKQAVGSRASATKVRAKAQPRQSRDS